ncbi:MAG: PAS domain S-box protein [Alphaproteobacteria bacterium]|nr:PAS domain S-box protein [Alphaproteobacteria bacterium]
MPSSYTDPLRRLGDERFELLVQAVTDHAIYMIEPDGTIASWNTGAARLEGYSREELIGQHFSRFFTAEDQAANKPANALATAVETGRWEDEGWRVRKDGTRFWALAVLDAIRDRDGNPMGFVKITRDMTERRAAQQELAESERRFRLLVASVIDYALFTLDLNGNIQSWNPGAQRLKGYSEREIIAKHFSIFYTEEARANGDPQRVLQTALTQGRFEGEGWRVRKDGTRFWANVVIDAIRDESETIIGFAKITRDISERRALEEAKEQLYQAQKMETVGQLTGGVAHDFNNLLTAVSGSHALLRRIVSDPRALSLLDTAERAVARGARLTQQLLAFSRQHQLQPQKTNSNELITSSEALLRHAAGERAVLRLDLLPRLWTTNIDQSHFQSALLNLVVNARDALEDKAGAVTIETRNVHLNEQRTGALGGISGGDYVLIAVHDDGRGMTAATKSRAVEPFFTTKAPGKGSGLGLSQVYGFVRQSNGQIEIDSTPGRGTTVRMFLPRLVDASETDADASSPERKAGSVLITEDDPDVLTVSVETLRLLGYEVYSAANAAEAMTILRRDAPIDVLFTDVVMPDGINGIELVREARRLRPEIRVLLCSGYSPDGIQTDESTSFLTKPYMIADLARELAALMSQRSPGG